VNCRSAAKRGVLVQSQTACEVQIDAPEDAEFFVREIEPDCLALVLDANGNHVIQRCLQKFRAPHTDPIHEVVLSNCLNVARHRHGCCVLQRCIDYMSPERQQALAMAVAEHGLGLSQNAYGNYVVQVLPLHVCPCIGSCPCTVGFPCMSHICSRNAPLPIQTGILCTACTEPASSTCALCLHGSCPDLFRCHDMSHTCVILRCT
jgi:hypothetical protein